MAVLHGLADGHGQGLVRNVDFGGHALLGGQLLQGVGCFALLPGGMVAFAIRFRG